MPLQSREYGTYEASAGAPSSRADAIELLSQPAWSEIVDLLAWREGDTIHVRNHRGHVTFPFTAFPDAQPGGRSVLTGEDVLARQDPLALGSLAEELADPRPAKPDYPWAQERLCSALADPERSPDLIVVHSDAHFWPERGGHLGEHGNLGVLQSRAPLLLSGSGVTPSGVLPAAARTIDVAPTLAWLSGADETALASLDGSPLTHLVQRGAKHVVGLLLDGANCQALIAGAESGELPTMARLLERGLALQGGAIAEFPSITLVNHTSALTGLGPGRHGIMNNAFFDRHLGEQILANDSSTWHGACDLLRPGVQTLWELSPQTNTACVNEPIDRGSAYATMQLIRASGEPTGAKVLGGSLPDPAGDPHTSAEHLGNEDYNWSSRIDAMGLMQMQTLWANPEPPALTWWNVILTDAAHHNGGAHSSMAIAGLKDCDARIGAWLQTVEDRGLLEDTVILVTADHGMTMADEGCRGDWLDALSEAGIAYRDESYGFLYFDV